MSYPSALRTSFLAAAVVLAVGTGCPNDPDPVPPIDSCQTGQSRPCYSGPAGTQGVGACTSGFQLCENGAWASCLGQTLPSNEVCNGVDDDCNGQVDEGGGPQTCGQGICLRTVQSCENGIPQTCTPGTPSAVETCDGLDDNCDGQVDEGCQCVNGATQSCFTGPASARNVGVCSDGTQLCVSGQWSSCTGAVVPTVETCNGLDDDCNGVADDGDPEGGQSCGTGLQGACSAGVTECRSGVVECNQVVQPSAETCNGIDDDCNGLVDESDPDLGTTCVTGMPGVCEGGTRVCSNGALQCAPTTPPSPELCNGLDDNCDGTIDEGNPGGGAMCSTGLQGACGDGLTTCSSGNITCTQVNQPQPETCNGIDDNCDGQVDEGNPPGGGSCTTGQPGICAAGTYSCAMGAGQCIQTNPPEAEICGDGLDNDCDGVVDNGCGGGGTCAHDKCVTGAALVSGCEPCVTQICNADPYCCTTDWDILCVDQVPTVCGQSCSGICSHDKCVTGAKLTSGCDPCVTQICNVDPYCCNNEWDSVCVGQVSSVCGQSCPP
jgi:Notch-like protein